MEWFEEYLRNPNFSLHGIYEDSVTFNVTQPKPFVYMPRETPNYNYHKPVDPNLWFNLEADLMGKRVIEQEYDDNVGDYEVVAEYDLVYAKPTSYTWLD
jgi:hypothetical protein